MQVSMRFQGWRGFHKRAMVFGPEILEYGLGRAAAHPAQGLRLEKGGLLKKTDPWEKNSPFS
jgi:hypothetical protein